MPKTPLTEDERNEAIGRAQRAVLEAGAAVRRALAALAMLTPDNPNTMLPHEGPKLEHPPAEGVPHGKGA